MSNITAIVKDCPLLHNGTRYEVGDTIELSQEEADKISIYLDQMKPLNAPESKDKDKDKGKDKGTAQADKTAEKSANAEDSAGTSTSEKTA